MPMVRYRVTWRAETSLGKCHDSIDARGRQGAFMGSGCAGTHGVACSVISQSGCAVTPAWRAVPDPAFRARLRERLTAAQPAEHPARAVRPSHRRPAAPAVPVHLGSSRSA